MLKGGATRWPRIHCARTGSARSAASARTPLDARVVERVEEPRYTREKVWFWSEPHEPVGAYLLLPNGADFPAPAVLCLHQHAGQFHLGKSEPVGLAGDPDMAYARELAERGYVTITPDFKGFEERRDTVLEGRASSTTSPAAPGSRGARSRAATCGT